MGKGLISTLTYMYRFINLGRGALSAEELGTLGASAHTLSNRAGDVMRLDPESDPASPEAALDLHQAAMIEQHIAESIDWQLRQEII